MTTLEKAYQPTEIESHWYNEWEKRGYFAPQGKGEPYTMVLPPPNVTGSLHMGHGFGCTLMDVLIRYERMCGKNTLWQGGTDHAGIATQMVVERQLNLENQTRHHLGREAFLEKIWSWKKTSGDRITHQLRRLGASIDWEHLRFTMDEGFDQAVRQVFIKLHEAGLIYRGKKLVNWDPVLLTAISDLEVVREEEKGELWYIRYPLAKGKGSLTIATTRPETLLGDAAVAVHPDDERYQGYIGQSILLPIAQREIPIIADETVDRTFGTGCVKITPAHDFNDHAMGLRHGLQPINIFTPAAELNDEVPPAYRGLDRFVARKKLIEDLKSKDLLEKVEPHTLSVPRGDRTGVILEPYLTDQWYICMKPLATAAIKAVRQQQIRFVPEHWSKTYFQWMENIEDWCISRQLWWGHRIPVWYDEAHHIYVGENEEQVRSKYQLGHEVVLRQDEDVLDTWFSASLWPLVSLDWPTPKGRWETFFPTQILVTGFDIIFFWVARMIMMSLYLIKEVPFREVYITGLIRDREGHKMSKSKGNVLDPLDLIDGITLDTLIQKRTFGLMQPKMAEKIEKATRQEFPEGIPSYGTDALRMTFCSLASYTREIRFDTNRLGGYRHFCNKLWNAARYVLMNTETHAASLKQAPATLSLPDRWILSRLQQTITEVRAAFAVYRFDLVAQCLYEFTWNQFCDWYLELTKPILMGSNEAEAAATRYTLIHVLEKLLRLLHPIMPFITEALWQRVKVLVNSSGKSIMLSAYPVVESQQIDEEAIPACEWLKSVITAIRTLRSEKQISPQKTISVFFRHGSTADHAHEKEQGHFLKKLAKLDSITWLKSTDTPPPATTTIVGALEIFMPMDEMMREEEVKRLNKESAKLHAELATIEKKLSNASFVERAPQSIVEKEQARAQELRATLEKLKHQLARLL
jgi:valyl-tRNA synthetase